MGYCNLTSHGTIGACARILPLALGTHFHSKLQKLALGIYGFFKIPIICIRLIFIVRFLLDVRDT